jgi:hypothetical protein
MTETMNEGVEDEFTKPLVLKNGCYSNQMMLRTIQSDENTQVLYHAS